MRTSRTAFVAVLLNAGKLARELPRPRAASAKPGRSRKKKEENVVFGECQEMILRINFFHDTIALSHSLNTDTRPFRIDSGQFVPFIIFILVESRNCASFFVWNYRDVSKAGSLTIC